MEYSNIPKELKERDKWIVTNREKKPIHPTGLHVVSGFEPEHWISFEKALELHENKSEAQGIAYVFTEADPFVGIYLNKCLLDGKISRKASEIYQTFNSYTEHSQSPNGLNIIIKARLKSTTGYQITTPGEKRPWLEIVDRKQYFIMTGNFYKQPRGIEPRLEHLQRFETELNNKPISKPDFSDIYLFKYSVKAVLPDWKFTEKNKQKNQFELVGNCPYQHKHRNKTKRDEFTAYITNSKSLYARCQHTDCINEVNRLNQELNDHWLKAKENGPGFSFLTNVVNTAQLIEEPVPEKDYLVEDLIPAKGVGIVTGPAGTGKTFWLLALACAVAAERPFHGRRTKSGRVLMVFGEETKDEIHRRLDAQLKKYQDDDAKVAIAQNLDVLSAYSRSAVFQEEAETNHGRMKTTPLYDELLHSDYSLIILDPLARFYNGDENDMVSATRFIELLEAIVARNGASLLISHHTQEHFNGSDETCYFESCHTSALLSAIPWICQLSTLNPNKAQLAIEEGYQQIEGDNPKMWLRQTIRRTNGLKPGMQDWLFRRGQNGILEKREPFSSSY